MYSVYIVYILRTTMYYYELLCITMNYYVLLWITMYYYIYIEKQHTVFSLLWLLPISGQLVVTFNIILQTIVQLLV